MREFGELLVSISIKIKRHLVPQQNSNIENCNRKNNYFYKLTSIYKKNVKIYIEIFHGKIKISKDITS